MTRLPQRRTPRFAVMAGAVMAYAVMACALVVPLAASAQDASPGPAWSPVDAIRAAPAPAVRDVTGGRLLRVAPKVEGADAAAPGLRRLPSRAAVSPEPSDAGPSNAAQRFHRVVIEDAGHFAVEGHRIALAGVKAPTPRTRCTGTGGAVWPCGKHALAAVRRFVRTRALDCDAPTSSDETEAAGRVCKVGGTVLNAWVVAQGWAVPTDDAAGRPWHGLNAEARRAGRGIYRDLGRGEARDGGIAREVAPEPVLVAQ